MRCFRKKGRKTIFFYQTIKFTVTAEYSNKIRCTNYTWIKKNIRKFFWNIDKISGKSGSNSLFSKLIEYPLKLLERNQKQTEDEHQEHTVKTRVSFRPLLQHRNSAWASLISTLKNVCLSVKTTLRLSYRVLEMTLLSV
jgi:hypothetical protein